MIRKVYEVDPMLCPQSWVRWAFYFEEFQIYLFHWPLSSVLRTGSIALSL